MFVKINPFRPCLLFKSSSLEEHMKSASLGQVLVLPANIRLGLKGLPGTNTVASFITQGPGNFLRPSF